MPHASTRSGRSRGLEPDRQRLDVVHVRQQVEVADDVARVAPRRCRRPSGSRRGSAYVRLGRRDRRRTVDEADLDLAGRSRAAGRRGGASGRTGVGASTGVPKRVRPCVPPVRRSSPVIGGPSFLRWTSMAIQAPIRAWPWRRTVASIVQSRRWDDGRGRSRRPPTGAPRRASRAATAAATTARGERRTRPSGTVIGARATPMLPSGGDGRSKDA